MTESVAKQTGMNIKKIDVKRIICAVCVVCLLFIDYKAANDSWYIWIITDNLVGVVLSLVMCSAYPLKEFRKPFYIFWNILGPLLTIGGYKYWFAHQVGNIMGYWITVPLNIWFLGNVVFKYIEKIFITKELKLHFAKWEYLFIICMLLMFIIKSDAVWPLYFLIIFLMLWHSPFTPEDKRSLFMGVLDGLLIGFIILQGYAFMNTRYLTPRYRGYFWNCNRSASIYLLTFSSLLGRILLNSAKLGGLSDSEEDKKLSRKTGRRNLIIQIFAAFVVGLIIYTGCRTAIIGTALIYMLYLFVGESRILRHSPGRMLAGAGLNIFMVIVMIPLLYFPIRYCPAAYAYLRTEIGNLTKGTNDVLPPEYFEEGVTFKEALDEIVLRYFKSDIVSDEENVAETGSETGAENDAAADGQDGVQTDSAGEVPPSSDDHYTLTYSFLYFPERGEFTLHIPKRYFGGIQSVNHRICIYIVLIENMNILGHTDSDVIMTMHSDVPGVEEAPINNEQNFIIHYLYVFGVPLGLFFCILLLAELIYQFIRACKGKTEDLIFLMFALVFICIGLTEIVWVPGQIVLILLFVAPLFFEDKALTVQ